MMTLVGKGQRSMLGMDGTTHLLIFLLLDSTTEKKGKAQGAKLVGRDWLLRLHEANPMAGQPHICR